MVCFEKKIGSPPSQGYGRIHSFYSRLISLGVGASASKRKLEDTEENSNEEIKVSKNADEASDSSLPSPMETDISNGTQQKKQKTVTKDSGMDLELEATTDKIKPKESAPRAKPMLKLQTSQTQP